MNEEQMLARITQLLTQIGVMTMERVEKATEILRLRNEVARLTEDKKGD